MISLTVTGLFNCTDLEIHNGAEVFKVGRCYIGSQRADSYPNSLVFKVSTNEIALLANSIAENDSTTIPNNPWLLEELNSILGASDHYMYITVPFTIRRSDEPFTNFRRTRSNNRVVILHGTIQVFVGGQQLESLCSRCRRGFLADTDNLDTRNVCPDFNTNDSLSLNCLKTAYFLDSSQDSGNLENRVHYINSRGELVYAEQQSEPINSTDNAVENTAGTE